MPLNTPLTRSSSKCTIQANQTYIDWKAPMAMSWGFFHVLLMSIFMGGVFMKFFYGRFFILTHKIGFTTQNIVLS